MGSQERGARKNKRDYKDQEKKIERMGGASGVARDAG